MLGDGTIPVSRDGLDTVPGRPTEHLRALLQHHGLLPQRNHYLPRFEQWIDDAQRDQNLLRRRERTQLTTAVTI